MGIGFECARACLKYGADVTICARGEGTLKDAEAALKNPPAQAADPGTRRRMASERTNSKPQVDALVADVSDPEDVERLLDRIVSALGRCDGLIHAAAILGPAGRITALDDLDAWFETLRINLFGTFLVARAAARRMQRSGGGRMVLFAGGGASAPFPNYSAYASSKVGVVRFAETIAQELAPEIEVNALAPGLVATRMLEQTLQAGERAGKGYVETARQAIASGATPPTVAAEAAAFLISDAAKGITGKFVAAVYDGYRDWPSHLAELRDSDLFTLRRILPRDRGLDWQ